MNFLLHNDGVDGWGEIPEKHYPDKIRVIHNGCRLDDNFTYNISSISEPPSILPYRQLDMDYLRQMDLVVTWREEIMESLNNTAFMPFGTTWIEDDYVQGKKKNKISYLTSAKLMTNAHEIRHKIYNMTYNINLQNGFSMKSYMSPPRIDKKSILLNSFKFSIVLENGIYRNYFTEKLIDCFVTRTVPIYRGCPNIEEFFDDSSIIRFDTEEQLLDILNSLEDGVYESMIAGIENNYNRSKYYYDYFGNLYSIIDKEIYGIKNE